MKQVLYLKIAENVILARDRHIGKYHSVGFPFVKVTFLWRSKRDPFTPVAKKSVSVVDVTPVKDIPEDTELFFLICDSRHENALEIFLEKK